MYCLVSPIMYFLYCSYNSFGLDVRICLLSLVVCFTQVGDFSAVYFSSLKLLEIVKTCQNEDYPQSFSHTLPSTHSEINVHVFRIDVKLFVLYLFQGSRGNNVLDWCDYEFIFCCFFNSNLLILGCVQICKIYQVNILQLGGRMFWLSHQQ